MQQKIKDIMEKYVDALEPFTALQISNDLKKNGENIRHREVSGIIRDSYNYYFAGVYERTSIDVEAEILNDNGQLEIFKTQALLYHPSGFDPKDYDKRELRAINNDQSKNDTNVDLTDDVADNDNSADTLSDDNIVRYDLSSNDGEVISNDDGGISFENNIVKDGTVTIYETKLNLTSFNDIDEFNLLIYPKMIFLKKASKNGVMTFSESKGKKILRIRKSILELAGITKESQDKVWIHMYDDQIVLNSLHPVVMSWEKYKNKVVTFKVDTPESDSGVTEQTVVLKIDGFKQSKKGDFLVYGRNLKRIDDKHSVDNVHRQYRFERIHADTVEEVTFV